MLKLEMREMYEYEIRNGLAQNDLLFLTARNPEFIQYLRTEFRNSHIEIHTVKKFRNRTRRRPRLHNLLRILFFDSIHFIKNRS